MATTEEYGLGIHQFPRGWFMIAEADEVQNKALPLRFFGRDFVIYRGESGKVFLMDAYCPHMGTHLGGNTTSYVVIDGQIEGDSIRCPYHAWRFAPTVNVMIFLTTMALFRLRHVLKPGL